MRHCVLVVCLLAAMGGTASLAGDRIGIGVKAGTLGLGVDLTGRVNDFFSLRGTFSQYDYSHSFNSSGIDYDGTLKVGGYGVILDFHPMKGNFRLSAGFLSNRNKVDADTTPTSNIEIGSSTYTPAQVGTLTGEVRFSSTAPYFGIGFGSAARSPGRVRLVFDLGVLSQGSGQVTLSSSTGLVSAADLKQEEAQIEDDIKNYKLWPVAAFGVSFRI